MYNMKCILLSYQNFLKYYQMIAKIYLYKSIQMFCFYKILISIINILNKYFVNI